MENDQPTTFELAKYIELEKIVVLLHDGEITEEEALHRLRILGADLEEAGLSPSVVFLMENTDQARDFYNYFKEEGLAHYKAYCAATAPEKLEGSHGLIFKAGKLPTRVSFQEWHDSLEPENTSPHKAPVSSSGTPTPYDYEEEFKKHYPDGEV